MPPEVELTLWRKLRGAFKIKRMIFTPVLPELAAFNIEQYATMEEALDVAVGERAFLEPTGYKSMHELPQGDITLIFGNANMDNMAHANVNETFSIKTDGRTHLYGCEAAAIALAIRYGQ